ncbi:hypothetical protein NPIL_625011 [Nephila pilipes]|uniref:Uncharacterized protein n=1 Tax=Nephila pilipes TaxID=299642 RepID=A0A8X6IZ91_NEPPI|nr:hypothetical protein NPIL_625011 [Nephila pilipes]
MVHSISGKGPGPSSCSFIRVWLPVLGKPISSGLKDSFQGKSRTYSEHQITVVWKIGSCLPAICPYRPLSSCISRVCQCNLIFSQPAPGDRFVISAPRSHHHDAII